MWKTVENYEPITGTNLAQKLLDSGLLFLVNQSVLHHFGMALNVGVDDEDKVYSLGLNETEDPDGIWFDEESIIEGRKKLREFFGQEG
jgi:hypothetical protein